MVDVFYLDFHIFLEVGECPAYWAGEGGGDQGIVVRTGGPIRRNPIGFYDSRRLLRKLEAFDVWLVAISNPSSSKDDLLFNDTFNGAVFQN